MAWDVTDLENMNGLKNKKYLLLSPLRIKKALAIK
jgi:hypothetical protein